MSVTLADASTPVRDGDGFAITFPRGWLLGRGVFGGLVFASFARAFDRFEADARRPLRSLAIEIPAPVEPDEPCAIAVEVIRRAKHTSTLYARLVQRGAIVAHATGVLAETRTTSGRIAWDSPAPPARPWRDTPVTTVPASFAPEFSSKFEYRLAHGMPFEGGDARTDGWIRPLAPGAPRDAGFIAAVVDAWYPAALVRLGAPRPMSTIAFKLDLLGDLSGLDVEAPLHYRGHAPACSDGYFVEVRELWGEDGRQVAINQQTFVMIQ